MKHLFLFPLVILLACEPSTKEQTDTSEIEIPKPSYEQPSHHISALTKIMNAHGGMEQWKKMKSLSYTKGDEKTITNLWNRHILVSTDEKSIGFDGKNVWVTPETAAASRARFYHNLYFYFYAMPFVVGDQGAIYEEVSPMELEGKKYNGLKVSYKEGVGDTSDDNYIIWSDPATHRMEWLMYTVTYKSDEPSEDYRLIKYSDWKEFSGLTLLTKLQWYEFENGIVGKPKDKSTEFENISIGMEAPDESLFKMPQGAQVAER